MPYTCRHLLKVSAEVVSNHRSCSAGWAFRLVLQYLAATERLGTEHKKLRRRDLLIRMKPWGEILPVGILWLAGRGVWRQFVGTLTWIWKGLPAGGAAGSKIGGRNLHSCLACGAAVRGDPWLRFVAFSSCLRWAALVIPCRWVEHRCVCSLNSELVLGIEA